MEKMHLINYLLEWADNVMILGQRNSEWCGHGPILEQDIAITNISLDLIGEARNIYQYIAELEGNGKTEDDYPFLRLEHQFLNVQLVEQPNTDWAYTIVRQCLFDCYHHQQLSNLQNAKDSQIAAIATKSLKEVNYHLRYSSEWMIRLGDGTDESHHKMQKAVNELYKFYGELFEVTNAHQYLISNGVVPKAEEGRLKATEKLNEILHTATLSIPDSVVSRTGGKNGVHTEHLGFLLATMQYMQRAYPNMTW